MRVHFKPFFSQKKSKHAALLKETWIVVTQKKVANTQISAANLFMNKRLNLKT